MTLPYRYNSGEILAEVDYGNAAGFRHRFYRNFLAYSDRTETLYKILRQCSGKFNGLSCVNRINTGIIYFPVVKSAVELKIYSKRKKFLRLIFADPHGVRVANGCARHSDLIVNGRFI